MDNTSFEFQDLLEAIVAFAKRSMSTIIVILAAITCLGFVLDYFFIDSLWSGVVLSIGQFVICYFLVVGLARHAGLIAEGEMGPGFGEYFALSFVMGIATSIGYALLVIPGIILSIRWTMAFPVLFAGTASSAVGGSLGESWQMSGPVFWKLLAVYLFAIVLVAITMASYIYVADSPDRTFVLIGYAVANIAAAINIVFNFLVGFAAYLLLRGDSEDLAAVFS